MIYKNLSFFLVIVTTTSCTFNFELTSQKTALENQVMGTYQEIEDELVLSSTVRGAGGKAKTTQPSPDLDPRLNQEFNKDDLEELKFKGAVGEGPTGFILVKNRSILRPFDEKLVREENQNRNQIWTLMIERNRHLTEKDRPIIQKTYAQIKKEDLKPGQWYQDEGGEWHTK